MTLLEIIRKKQIATATVATGTPKLVPTVANVACVAVAEPTNENIKSDIEKMRSWLFHIGEPELDHYLVLNRCRRDPEAFDYFLGQIEESQREERYKKVLAMLANKSDVPRAFITDMERDPDNVIMTIAIRDQYTFEMLIPKDRYDPFTLFELIKRGAIQ